MNILRKIKLKTNPPPYGHNEISCLCNDEP